MSEAESTPTDDSSGEEEAEAETPRFIGRWRVARFHLDATDATNTLELAPAFPFSC